MAKSKTQSAIDASTKKKDCPFASVEEFMAVAKPIALVVDGQAKAANVKAFSSGSFGWFMNDKVTLMIDGKPTKCQCNFNIVVVGSKPNE